MVIRNGLFVPPNCPTSRGRPIDIRSARFRFFIHDCTADRRNRDRLTETEMFMLFGESDEYGESPNAVESDSLVVPIGSAIAAKAWRIAGDRQAVEATESAKVAKVRDALCDRVAQCHGVIKGECWALGAAGIHEVIKRA